MSTRAERRRQQRTQSGSPKKGPGAAIAAAVAVVAVIAIIVYAVAQHNEQVNGAAVAPNPSPLPSPHVAGSRAPQFSIATPRGTISSQTLAGKPYLLELFATWCPHCQRMTTVLRDIRSKFPPQQLEMVSITGSPWGAGSTTDKAVPEDQADVDMFDAFYKVTWPTAFDKDLSVASAWGQAGFPQIYIVNRDGVIVYSHSGEVAEQTLIAAIKKAGA